MLGLILAGEASTYSPSSPIHPASIKEPATSPSSKWEPSEFGYSPPSPHYVETSMPEEDEVSVLF